MCLFNSSVYGFLFLSPKQPPSALLCLTFATITQLISPSRTQTVNNYIHALPSLPTEATIQLSSFLDFFLFFWHWFFS